MPAGSSRSIRGADPDIKSIRFTPHSKAGLVQQEVQSEGSFLACATPFFVWAVFIHSSMHQHPSCIEPILLNPFAAFRPTHSAIQSI